MLISAILVIGFLLTAYITLFTNLDKTYYSDKDIIVYVEVE